MKAISRATIFGLVLAALGAARGAESPSILHTLTGSLAWDEFGTSLVSLGDVDGDGVPDFAVGARQTAFSKEAVGYVQLFSGRTWEVLKTWKGDHQAGWFGKEISAIQDLDGDHKMDVVIGNANLDVSIFSTGSGDLLKKIPTKLEKGTGGGMEIVTIDDVNHDGIQDILVGQGGQSSNTMSSFGRVAIYSVKDGMLIWEKLGQEAHGKLGDSIIEVGDIDGDGVNDVAVGQPHGWSVNDVHVPGKVFILSGVDGREIRRLGDDPVLSFFGYRMAKLGDLDGDGMIEFAIAAVGYGEERRSNLGWVGIYSTRDFKLLRSFTGIDGGMGLFQGDQLGIPLSSAGDVDGDAVPDLLLGTRRFGDSIGRSAWGRVDLRSGRTGQLLSSYEGIREQETFVSSLASLGDIDGDGRSEFLIGSIDFPVYGGPGRVLVLKFRPELPLFIRGDANQDGQIDISDAVTMIEVLSSRQPAGPCPLSLDVDGDRFFDIYDPIQLLFYLFVGDFAPAPPFPDCGRYGGFQENFLTCEFSTCQQ